MNRINKIRIFLLILLFTVAIPTVNAAEIDDSSVFVDAFNAYQQKDYLQTIEKSNQLIQVFPNSPLRDVTLLLIARSHLKSGDNLRAAKNIALFNKEFPSSTLKASIEEELISLNNRHQNGEVLLPDKSLQAAARKVSSDRIAREKAAEQKLELERIAKIKAEEERTAKIKFEKEKLEKERILAEKLARANIKVSIFLRGNKTSVPAGSIGTFPVEISNKSKNAEEFFLNVNSGKEYGAVITSDDKSDVSISRIQLNAGESFIGSVRFKMPVEMVDGHRSSFSVNAVSAKFRDLSFSKDTVVISSAPLVRVVAKLAKQKVAPGEKLSYQVAVLNVGSLPAHNLTVRLWLPPHVDFLQTANVSFNRGSDGSFDFTLGKVDVGGLSKIFLDVKVSENSATGDELLGRVEVVNESLSRRDIFPSGISVVQSID